MFNKKLCKNLYSSQNSPIFTPMFREYDNIRLRISPIIHDFLNKKSQESGVSKQQIIRVMIEKCLSEEYGENIILNARKIKLQITKEYETNQTTASNPEK